MKGYIVYFSQCGPLVTFAKNMAEVVDCYPDAIAIILLPHEVYYGC